jgi:hypothetical protein
VSRHAFRLHRGARRMGRVSVAQVTVDAPGVHVAATSDEPARLVYWETVRELVVTRRVAADGSHVTEFGLRLHRSPGTVSHRRDLGRRPLDHAGLRAALARFAPDLPASGIDPPVAVPAVAAVTGPPVAGPGERVVAALRQALARRRRARAHPRAYAARPSLSRSAGAIAVCAGGLLPAWQLLAGYRAVWPALFVAGLFAVPLVVRVRRLWSEGPPFQVDRGGVLLRVKDADRVVLPWAEVRSIVLGGVELGGRRRRAVGVVTHRGGDVPEAIVLLGEWSVDVGWLRHSVTFFAPHVAVGATRDLAAPAAPRTAP